MRDFTRKPHNGVKNVRAKELFELHEDLRYFEWEQDLRVTVLDERLRNDVIHLAMGVVFEAAMALEYGKKKAA